MSASRPWSGNSDSPHYMIPEVRAEALCDELRSGARPPDKTLTFCICGFATAMIRAALAAPSDPRPPADPSPPAEMRKMETGK